MSKLVMSMAILALEEKGYEQAQNKPFSFGKVQGQVTTTCRLAEVDGVTGRFVSSLTYEGETWQGVASVPVMIPSDVERGEGEALRLLQTELAAMREGLEMAWRTRDATLRTAQALATIK